MLIVKNEEQNIAKCLESISFADEIVVLDTGSNDKTVDICKSYNVKLFFLDEWEGFGVAKQKAVDYAVNDWILSIDADEVVSNELKNSIIKILENPQFNAYSIKRNSYYLGKLIKHSGWNKDYPKRLFNKNYARFNVKKVHESLLVNGSLAKIEECIYHNTYPTINSHIGKFVLYTDLAIADSNKSITLISAIFRGFSKFVKMFFIQAGFLDGKEGLVLSILSSFGVLIKYFKLWEKSRIKSQK